MRYYLLIFLLTLFYSNIQAQTYTSWLTGNAADVNPTPQPGVVLAGGGTDNDQAMRWMLARANGGDIVVLRASGSDGYNSYFYSELNITVNSVETLLITSQAAANDSYVVQQIRNAEAVFIAGGDQYNYYQYWKDTQTEEALNYLLNTKKATVGGTSAGMAILGKIYYTPDNQGITASEALLNPFHSNMTIIGKDDFLDTPWLSNVITDTHYDNRSRAGRQFTFLARIAQDWGIQGRGIACNEHTAVCIDEAGKATVFGSESDDVAYFLQTENAPPETCQANQQLTWYKDAKAVKAYKLRGTETGTAYFSLADWQTGSGGQWYYWYAQNGILTQAFDITTGIEDAYFKQNLQIYPNPLQDWLTVKINNPARKEWHIRLLNLQGDTLQNWQINATQRLDMQAYPKGLYWLIVQVEGKKVARRFVKQ